ncbi:MAG TPA: protein kinase, partial [Pirellulaceae bacterium]|nr:protein kinase [Pirellulaceae bacterium]
MFQCPYCNCVTGDDGELSGRCPSCGSLVRWNDDAPADAPSEESPAPAAVESVAPPLSAGLPRLNDSNASFDRVMQTIVHRAAYEAALADEAAVVSEPVSVAEVASPAVPAPPAAKAVEPGSITRGGNDATIDFGLKNAAEAASPAQIPEVWKGTITPTSTPRMTLKSQSVVTDSQPGLVIRAKQLRQTGEYGVDDADYELLEQIGEGGVGIVYAARQASVDRTVAIKMLKPESKLDAYSRQKFLGEAVVTGDLDHPNIVPIYDLGSDDRGALFYSMKRVRGTPWSEALASKSLLENLEILLKVADAIAFAHSRGIVHRDIKPENVMLGDFGEVLVMDWGIALSTNVCLRAGSITQSQSMGGTPAYMSPEMATGPIERIGDLSDVYLLGGVLFEVITGHPPHTGQDVLACLYAAARNEIRPTDKSGELLEIAYHAMATEPATRHASVREFQEAIRTYQSHSESIALSSRAATDLRTAQRTRNYQDFARAVFAAQEALALWRKNESAATVLEQSQLAYADCAHSKEDFDLGLSLLDEFNVSHQPLIKKLVQGQRERATRQRRVQQLRTMATSLAVVILAVVSVGMIYIRGKNQTLNDQNEQLGKQTKQLVQNESNLKELNSSLEDKSNDLKKQKEKVELTATDLARQRTVAEASARQAIDKERFAEQVSYLSQIGLAAAQTRENAFLNIRQSLSVYNDPKLAHLRNWEWGRLNFLSSLAKVDQPADGRVESLATAADDPSFMVTGTSSGALQFWDTTNWQATTHSLPQAIRTVALSHDGRLLAMASVDAEHRILVWETAAWRKLAAGAAAPQPLHTLTGHQDAVLHLTFDATGVRVLSTSQDQTARLWNLQTAQAVEFTGHAGPVWTGVISSDGLRVFTAGDDRTVGIWNAVNGARIERFRGHKGPVYCVACIAGNSAGDYQVVSAGADRRLLLWNAADVRGVDFKAVRARIVGEAEAEATSEEPTLYRVLGSHTSDVYDVRFARDNRFVVSCGHDNTVRVWDRSAADERAAAYRVLRGHGGWVQACAMLDDRQVVSAGYDQSLKVWDLATYREVITLAGHEDAIMAANYSRDGSRIITAGRDRKALIWNANTGELVTTLDEGHNFLTSMVQFFGPTDPRMLTSAGDGSSIIWNIKTGSQLQRLTGTGSQ